MKDTLQTTILGALKNLGVEATSAVLEHPADLSHGDYSTNAALAYAKAAGMNPRALAEKIVAEILQNKPEEIEAVEIAGPGFINFKLSSAFFANALERILSNTDTWGNNGLLSRKKIMVEYTQPNPFKPFHIGHLMSNAIGESISRIVEACDAQTVRANYQGDIGPHVAKAIYKILEKGKPSSELSVTEQAKYIGACYSEGSAAYESDPVAKAAIDAINKKVYDKSDAAINEAYDWGRAITLDAFEELYTMLGTRFDHYFFESEMAPIGMEVVKKHVGSVFAESEGAIVFHAEEHNPKLHTRVFINSQGLPTYETKEIGLTVTKFEKENPDLSIVTTAIEQGEYMKVVQKAISLIYPDYESRMQHVTHGMMRFASGKMSSRKGNVVAGDELVRDAMDVVREKMLEREFSDVERETIARQVAVAAVKYSILKQATGGDIIYDFEKSISFEGDSGPYIQYTAVRAAAVLAKGEKEGIALSTLAPKDWQVNSLEKYLYRFPEVVARSYESLEPHHIATYLTELSSQFNSFYAEHKIVDATDSASGYKLALTAAFRATLVQGLHLLGIQVPEKM